MVSLLLLRRFPAGLGEHDFQGLFGYKVFLVIAILMGEGLYMVLKVLWSCKYLRTLSLRLRTSDICATHVAEGLRQCMQALGHITYVRKHLSTRNSWLRVDGCGQQPRPVKMLKLWVLRHNDSSLSACHLTTVARVGALVLKV